MRISGTLVYDKGIVGGDMAVTIKTATTSVDFDMTTAWLDGHTLDALARSQRLSCSCTMDIRQLGGRGRSPLWPPRRQCASTEIIWMPANALSTLHLLKVSHRAGQSGLGCIKLHGGALSGVVTQAAELATSSCDSAGVCRGYIFIRMMLVGKYHRTVIWPSWELSRGRGGQTRRDIVVIFAGRLSCGRPCI